jgi:hypothetical protein
MYEARQLTGQLREMDDQLEATSEQLAAAHQAVADREQLVKSLSADLDARTAARIGDQASQLGEDPGAWAGRCPPVGLHPVLRGGREVGDGVDPLGRDAEGEGQLDVPVAVGVDEGVHAAGRGGPDPVRDAVTVRDRDHAVALQPLVVALARQADDRGPGTARELGGNRADPPPAAPEMTTVSPSLGWTA